MKNIALNFQRLHEKEYSMDGVFQPAEYDWPGDWEGRALLALTCHFEAHGTKASHLHDFFQAIPMHTNADLYFGKPFNSEMVDEQQLSGHNWYLRGLLKYAMLFQNATALDIARSTVEHLYLPALSAFEHYPFEREATGGVSGNRLGITAGWQLSTDVGCAFMCVDGLAHYYEATKDDRVKALLDKLIRIFTSTDIVRYQFQTHTTLTCTRGILKMYEVTGEREYLTMAQSVFHTYLTHGMTLTYENFNWFGRYDTWTEPCAVTDSFMLATRLYHITQDDFYKTLARRIWFNGLQFCQRENGGAGPNTCVSPTQNILKISLYEAPFCCTMRYAEGLLEYTKNQELFTWNADAECEMDEFGRRFIDDKLLVKYNGEFAPIFSCNDIPKTQAECIELLVFEMR